MLSLSSRQACIVPLALALLRLVSGSAYIGCFDPSSLDGGAGAIYDNRTDTCPEIVAEGSLPYSNSWPFIGDDSYLHACRGWDAAPDPSYLVEGRTCGYPNVNVTLVDPPTQWTWAGCWYLSPTDDWVTVSNFSDCLTSCRSYPYAYGRYDDNSTISCLCSISQPPVDFPLNCGYGDPFWYTHPLSPSGLARRQEKEKKRRQGQMSLGLCPNGRKACNVPGSEGGSYECIDTDYEYESCGGCVNGDFVDGSADSAIPSGVDCSTIPGIAPGGVTCQQGQCIVFACEEDYALINGTCINV